MSPETSGNVFFEAVLHDQLLSIISFEKVTWISWRSGSTSVSPDLGTVFTTTGGAFSTVTSSDASAARFRDEGAGRSPAPACGSRTASSGVGPGSAALLCSVRCDGRFARGRPGLSGAPAG